MRIRGAGEKTAVGSKLFGSRQFARHPLTALMLASGMLPGWVSANDITVYDGSGRVAGPGVTQTTLDVTGNVTDITTATVRGNAGFNSFGNFKVFSGNTVNLHVPGSASHLVNLVHDSRAEINGTLNGLQNGKIGGHVIFADPHGFVVGSSGVVNVGSLTVTTPNVATMDELLRVATVDGHVNADEANAYIDALAAGELPVATLLADGSNAIVIEGMVNSNGSINLHGASVLVKAAASLQASTDVAQGVFASTVNTDGLAVGEGVARGDGGIAITASDTVELSGELAALMADQSGASIQLEAKRSVALSGEALIDSRGNGDRDAGDIRIGAPSIDLQDNARLVTSATGSGRAGDITLGASSDTSCEFCDASAEPQTLDELELGINAQGNPWLPENRAKAEIVVGADVQLDAGHADSGDRAGDLTLSAEATNRQLAGDAQASARIDVKGSLTGKSIDLKAQSRAEISREVVGSLLESGALKSDIDALQAREGWSDQETEAQVFDRLYAPVTRYGNAASHDPEAFLDAPDRFSSLVSLVPELSASLAKADSTITIGSTAVLAAAGDINLRALSERTVNNAMWQVSGLSDSTPFGFSNNYGQISGVTSVDVHSGASVNSARDLSVMAHARNNVKLATSAENSVDADGDVLRTMGLAVGMLLTDTETRATVEQGALLDVVQDVNVTAVTEQELGNTVSFKSSGDGAVGGPAVGLSILNSKTLAQFSADLVDARNLNLSAANIMHGQNLAVSVEAGATDAPEPGERGIFDRLRSGSAERDSAQVTHYLGDSVAELFSPDPSANTDDDGTSTATDSRFRLASALAISMAEHEVQAVLGAADAAPNVDLRGDLAVQALQRQSDMHNSAQSKVNASAKRDDGTVDGAVASLSVAAVYSELDQTARALIGDGTDITASRIGVGARNDQPLNLRGLDRWSSLEEVFSNLKLLAVERLGIIGKLSTQYANSTGEADSLSMAGSLSVLRNKTDASAWVGDSVNLTSTAAGDAPWSSSPLVLLPADTADSRRAPLISESWSWDAPISVQANNQLEQLAIAGNFDALFGVTGDRGVVGAGLNVQVSNNRAVAGIGADGSVAAQALDVSALQDEMLIGLSPSAGEGGSIAGNGSFVVNRVDATVHASVHSSARVDANRVSLDAEHALGVWSASGTLAAAENIGVGSSLAINLVNTDVYALVGNNNLRTEGRNNWRPASLGGGLASAGVGVWKVNDLVLGAKSSGQSGAFSVAGARARSERETQEQQRLRARSGGADERSQEQAGGLGDAIKDALTESLSQVTGELSLSGDASGDEGRTVLGNLVDGFWSKLGDFLTASGGPGGSGDPVKAFSLAAAASGSVNAVAQKNRSHLGNIVLDPRDTDGTRVNVLSLNQTHQLSGAGAGALMLSGGGQKSSFGSALSAAMAFNRLTNLTEATLSDASLNDNDQLNVQAASGGDQVALGLGLSAASGGRTNIAGALSGSAGLFANQTRASVVDSAISQRVVDPGTIAVNAYDRSRNLLGGGAFALSTQRGGSAGGSLVIADMRNTLEARWLGSSATDFLSLDVKANSASRVLAGALGTAASTGPSSASAAGSLFVVSMKNTVNALVDQSAAGDSALSGANVSVAAASVPVTDALNSIFEHDAAAGGTLSSSGLDLGGVTTTADIDVQAQTDDALFAETAEGIDTNVVEGESGSDTTSRDLFDNGSLGSEAVIGIAGSLAGTSGKAAAGGAFGVVHNASNYAARIANTDITLGGDLDLAALNGTDVLAGAVGVGGGTNLSVSGSATGVIGRGAVSTVLDMTDRTLVANNLVVEALKTGDFYSLAGSISASGRTAAVGGAFSINDLQQSASALVEGGVYQLAGDAILNAAQQSKIITAALSGTVSGNGVGIGGAMTYNRIADTTTAELRQAQLTANSLSIAASQPELGASIWSLAFNLAAGGGSVGLGAGVAVNQVSAERASTISDSTVNLSGDATLTSALDGEIWSVGIDAAGGGTAGVGGSYSFNAIGGSDRVQISNSSLISTNSSGLYLDASAGEGLTLASLAGSVTGGRTAAVGRAVSYNSIGVDRSALITGNSSVADFSRAELSSGSAQSIYSIAVAGGGAGTVALNGASATNILQGSARSAIETSALTIDSLSLSAANGKRTIWSLGLVLNGAGKAALGVANVNNVILAKRIAEIDDAELVLSGALSLISGGDALIRSAALGGGGAGTAAAGASVAVNVVEGEETARIKDSRVEGATALTVDVTRGEVDIKTLAGNVQGGGTGAGAGAVAISTVKQLRQALVENTALDLSAAAPVRVEALTGARINTLSLSGAGAGTAAAVFSNASNNIDAKTYTRVVGNSGSMGSLQIKATDNSQIRSLSGGIAGAGVAAVGVASATNRVANTIEASLKGLRDGEGFALNDLAVNARSDASIETLSVSGGFSGTAAANGGVATSMLDTTTRALVSDGAGVVAQNNVAVVAFNRDVLDSYAGVVAGSGNAAVSGILTVNLIKSDTEAAIRGASTRVTALALGTGVSVNNGQIVNAPNTQLWADEKAFNPVTDLQTGSETVRGIAVRATTLQQAGQMSVSAAVSLVPIASASIGGISNTSVLGGSTLAAIDQALINQDNAGAAAAQQVSVAAHAHTYSFGGVLNGALSLGAAAVAATADAGVISRDVTARIRGATVTSRGQTRVDARSTRAASNIVVSASGAIVGVAGSASVLVLEGSTEALVDDASLLTLGSLAVNANATNYLSASANTASGGVAGAGAGVGVGYNNSMVRAWLGAQPGSTEGRTRVMTGGAVSVEADSVTDAQALSVSISGGGAAAAGSVNMLIIENVTEAGVGLVDIGSSGRRAASLKIDAFDRLNVNSVAGSAALGGISLGASANILVANNATRAMLLDSQTWVTGAVDVLARRESDLQLSTVSGGVGGTVALGGSIGMMMLGSGTTQTDDVDALDELDAGGNGTLSMIDNFTARTVVETAYQTMVLDEDTGQYQQTNRSTTADTTFINQQGRIGSSSARLDAGDIYKHETLARVQGGRVDAGGKVSVKATDALYSRNLAGSAQLAGTAAVGGAAALTFSNSKISAEINPVQLNSNSLDVAADALRLLSDKPAVAVDAYTGSAGFAAGLGAGVGAAVMKNTVTASLGGELETKFNMNASARDGLDLDIKVLGGQLAVGGAAGVVVGIGERSSTVTLEVADNASLDAKRALSLSAISEGGSLVVVQGASGGLLAGVQAAVASALDNSSATLNVGANAQLAAQTLNLSAIARPRLEVRGVGVAVGGSVAMGGTVLLADADAKAYVNVNEGSLLTAHQAILRAAIERAGTADTVRASGVGVVGGLGLSANAVVARAINTTHSRIFTSSSSQLKGTSLAGQDASWALVANTDSRQRANTAGVTIGLLSLGAHLAKAGSTNQTQAQINSRFSGNNDAVRVAAVATNDSEARSVAGQGGLVSGAAATANTWDKGKTQADWLARGLGDTAIDNASLVLDASHTSRANAFVDSTNAGLVGVSGAFATNTVDLEVRSSLLSGSFVEAADYKQTASGTFIKAASPDFNVSSGSGGVLDLPAAKSITNIKLNTQALVGNGARLAVVGDWRNPGNMLIQAFNDIFARDRVKLDAGGAIAITRAESQVEVEKADSLVRIGEDAELFSIGTLTLSTNTVSDIDVSANTKAYGAAGAAQGFSLAKVTAEHWVDVQSDAKLRGYGDVRLYAGSDIPGRTTLEVDLDGETVEIETAVPGRANQATLVARTDIWNKTAFPVETDPVAQAIYNREQDITVASGALVESVGDVYAYANRGFGDLTGQGIGKDLYRKAAEDTANALGSLVGAGEVSLDIEYNFIANNRESDVRIDGDIHTGIFNNQILEIERLIFDPVTGEASLEVGEVSDGITYRLQTGGYMQALSARERELVGQLEDYGVLEQDRLAIEAELRLLRRRLSNLYQEMGGDVRTSGGAVFDSLPEDITIQILEVDPIIARPGNIFVKSDRLVGTGGLRAPGDARIDIDNKSAAFLSITNLEIPNREGGQLLFNDASMTGNASIVEANRARTVLFDPLPSPAPTAAFGEITIASNSPAPQITVNNSYNPATGGTFTRANGTTIALPAPDININGAVRNLRGNVELTASYGSIYINGDVRAQSISIDAGRDFVQNATQPFLPIGGDPSSNVSGGSLTPPATGSGTVAGNNVAISAQYLNINGLVQSGVADWNLSINESDFDEATNADFKAAKAAYNAGTGERYFQVKTTSGRERRVGYSFDFLNNNLLMDRVEAGGGYMELTGHIMSTGNGEIKVLDGFSRVNVANNSARTLQISGIDLGSGVEGTLRLNDVNFTGAFKGTDTVTSTIYTRIGDNIQVYRGASNEVSTNSAYLIDTLSDTRSTEYAVRQGRSYVWLTGQDFSVTEIFERYVDEFWELVEVGAWDYNERVASYSGEPRLIEGAEYMGDHRGSYWEYDQAKIDDLDFFEKLQFDIFKDTNPGLFLDLRVYPDLVAGRVYRDVTRVQLDEPQSEKTYRTSCAEHFIWCQVTRFHEREVRVTSNKEIVRNIVRADLPININFIGHDTGEVNLASFGSVELVGSIFNETGRTSITTLNQLLQASEEVVVAADDLTLNTSRGIGSGVQSVNVQLGSGSLSVVNDSSGDVNVQALNGGVRLENLIAFGGGVNLAAQGNITANSGVVIGGHAINLTSTQGSVGSLDSPLLINTDNTRGEARASSAPALFTARAVGDVAVEEISGDLALNQVFSGGDTRINVRDGDLVDANTNDRFDVRSPEEMRTLWSSVQLTGEAADESLEQQKTALVNAGNARYSRYWSLRNLRLEGGELIADPYEEDFSPTLNLAQENQFRELYGWDDAQLESYRTDLATQYQSLHAEFGGEDYNSAFNYELGAQELESVETGSSWTEQQLLFSVSRGLFRGEGGGSGKVEDLNIEASDITLKANKIGSTLAENVVIDLTDGFTGLSPEQRLALASAEADDIFFDEGNPNIINIIQREDLDVDARGLIRATSDTDIFLGGTRDFNIFDVQGGRIEIKTDGSITSANATGVVLDGDDVVLEAGGDIGTPTQALNLKVAGVLTARAQRLGLIHDGDLTIDYLLGRQGVNLQVDRGALLVKDNSFAGIWQEVEHIAGGDIELKVDGQAGLEGQRLNLATNPTNTVTLDISDDAWLGGIQGLSSTPGVLSLSRVNVGGRLDLANLFNLQQTGDWALGSLVLDVQNDWLADEGAAITANNGLSAMAGNQIRLGNVTATNTSAGISLKAAALGQLTDGDQWFAAGLMDLQSRGNVGSATRYLRVGADELNVRSDNGDLFLRMLGHVNAGQLTTLNGQQQLQSIGQVNLSAISSSGQINAVIEGRLSVDSTESNEGIVLNGRDFVGRSLLARNGDIVADLLSLDVAEMRTPQGLIDLQADAARVGLASSRDTLDMIVDGNLTLGAADSGLDMTLQTVVGSNGDIRFGTPAVTLADLNVSHIYSAQNLRIEADRDVFGGNAQAELDVLASGRNLAFGRLQSSTGDLLLQATDQFGAAQLLSPQGLIRLRAGSVDVGQAVASETLGIHSLGDLSLFSGRSGENLTLTTEAGSLGTIKFGLLADPDAEGVLEPAHLYSDANILVQTDGDIFGGNAEAVGEVRMIGRNLFFGRAESLAGDIYLQANGDAAESQGNMTGLLVQAHRDVAILANRDLVMPTVRFGGSYSLKAGRDLTVGVGRDLDVNGTAEAGRDLTFVVGGTVDLLGAVAGRDLSIRSGQAINIDKDVLAGGEILLEAADGDIRVGGNVLSTAIPYQGQALNGNVRLLASGDISAKDVGAAAGRIQADGLSLDFAGLRAANDINLLARGSIRVGESLSGGDQNWLADEQIGFDRVLAEGQALLDSLLDTRGISIQADQGLEVNAGWRSGVASPATVELQQAIAPTMHLRSGQAIRVGDASIGESANLKAQDIEFAGRHNNTGLLMLNVTGLNNIGGPGERFITRIDASHIVVRGLDTAYTGFDTTALQVDFEAATNVDYLFLTTPQAVVTIDNLSPGYRATANVQIYEMDKEFWLYQSGLQTYTNGYVLQRDFTHQVRVPNFVEGHQDGSVDYQNMTAAAFAALLVTPDNILLRLGELMNQLGGYAPTSEQDVKAREGGQSVNLDTQALSENGGDKEQSWEI